MYNNNGIMDHYHYVKSNATQSFVSSVGSLLGVPKVYSTVY